MRRLGARLGPLPVWIILGAAIGAIPLLGDYCTQIPMGRVVTPVMATVLLLAAVASDSTARGVGALAAAFLAHNAVAIALVSCDQIGMAKIMSGGDASGRKATSGS